jgi:hypothetical protein
LDSNSKNRLKNFGIDEMVVPVDDFPYVVDIKSDVNITSYEKLLNSTNSCHAFSHSVENIRLNFGLF